jgi:hypothetical protein
MKKSELRQLIKEEYEKITNTQSIKEQEVLDKHTIRRIEGVIEQDSLNNMQKSMDVIIKNMIDDGFDEEDIYEYIRGIIIKRIDNADWSIDEASKEEVENQKELNKELEKTTNIKKQMSSLKETDEDDDSLIDKEPTKSDIAKLKKDSIATIASKLQKIKAEMKKTLDEWKKAEGDKKNKLTQQLKDLTSQKKNLEKQL